MTKMLRSISFITSLPMLIGLLLAYSLPIAAQTTVTCAGSRGQCLTATSCPVSHPNQITPTPPDCQSGQICCALPELTPIYKPAGWEQSDTTCAQLASQTPPIKCQPGLLCEDIDKTFRFSHGAADYVETRIKKAICVDPSKYNAAEKEIEEVKFVPQITIPGSISFGGQTFTVRKGEGIVITSSTVAQYFALFYRFFVAALVVVAIVMVMWGGFKRIMAAGSPERIKDANDTIISALSGVVIALLSYSLLTLINPSLVSLKPLSAVEPIRRVDFSMAGIESEESLSADGPKPENLVEIGGENIFNPKKHKADEVIVRDLRQVALKLKEQGYSLIIADAYRTVGEQKKLILENCQNPAGSSSCNPKPGKPDTCPLPGFKAERCPHTTSRAVDVYGGNGDHAAITRDECLKDTDKCRQVLAMKALGQAMLEAGFCNLSSEPWHFEKPKMSSKCSTTY